MSYDLLHRALSSEENSARQQSLNIGEHMLQWLQYNRSHSIERIEARSLARSKLVSQTILSPVSDSHHQQIVNSPGTAYIRTDRIAEAVTFTYCTLLSFFPHKDHLPSCLCLSSSTRTLTCFCVQFCLTCIAARSSVLCAPCFTSFCKYIANCQHCVSTNATLSKCPSDISERRTSLLCT